MNSPEFGDAQTWGGHGWISGNLIKISENRKMKKKQRNKCVNRQTTLIRPGFLRGTVAKCVLEGGSNGRMEGGGFFYPARG